MKFCIKGVDSQTNEPKTLVYDNRTSELFHEDLTTPFKPIRQLPGDKITFSKFIPHYVAPYNPGSKDKKIKTLKIQLGLSCNYSCEYCSQRFVPTTEHANLNVIKSFILNLDNWLKEEPETIEFWGGEPFVYWKMLKPLVEALAEKFAFVKFQIVTNGSLLTDDIVDWLDEMEFTVAISHDGPGQNVRGPDPLDDPEQRRIIMSLFNKLAPKHRISFNSMVHKENHDRAAIQEYFDKLMGNNEYIIGEGGFIDVYDEGGVANSFDTPEEYAAFRTLTFHQIRTGKINKFEATRKRFHELVGAFENLRDADTLGQKCGMDKPDTIAVDLLGNVLTCQNVSAESTAPNGNSHKIGHVNRFDEIKLDTAMHWKFRDKCLACPVLQSCKGSCMFLQGEHFDKSCDNAYSDHLPFFASAFEFSTGIIPLTIEAKDGSLPPERGILWIDPKTIENLPKTRPIARKKNDE